MSFKENLLKKIKINQISKTVMDSIGTPDSGKKIDKNAMRSLLDMSDYKFQRVRDMDMYILEKDSAKKKILVLDNDLAIYHAAIDDVALRKSPTVKEMISIRNAIKILNDSDILISKKEASVRTLQNECIDKLNLSFGPSDIDEIVNDGVTSMERGYTDGVLECLTLFAELLGYVPPPKAFSISQHFIIGRLTQGNNTEVFFGPIVFYNLIHNTIKRIDDLISNFDKGKLEYFFKAGSGKEKASEEGPMVFEWLKKTVLQSKSNGD